MNVKTYKEKVIELFKSGKATEEQWKGMSDAVSEVSESDNYRMVLSIEEEVDPEFYRSLMEDKNG